MKPSGCYNEQSVGEIIESKILFQIIDKKAHDTTDKNETIIIQVHLSQRYL